MYSQFMMHGQKNIKSHRYVKTANIPVLLNFITQHYYDSQGRDSAVCTLTTLQATQSGV